MTSTEIIKDLSGNAEEDIQLLTARMLAERDREAKRLILEVLTRANDYAHMEECGFTPSGVSYADFLAGNCPFEMPDEETLTALRAIRTAADAGDADAQYRLAMVYVSGMFGFPDPDAAAALLQKAADGGSMDAVYELGVCYMNGEGVPFDPKKAEECFITAGEAGNVDAMIALGAAYRGGKGLPEDPAAVYRWYKRAADAGCAAGYLHLGICTFNGTGTEASIEKAIEYVQTADRLGAPDAKMLLRRLQRYYEEGDIDANELAARNRT